MAPGKFSNPRPHRDEERQIEETFRQLTGQAPVKKILPQEPTCSDATQKIQLPMQEIPVPAEEAFPQSFEDSLKETFQESQTAAPRPQGGAYARQVQEPKKDTFDILFDDELFQEDPEPPEADFLDKALAFINQNKKLVLAFACAAALLLLVGVLSVFFAGSADPYDDLILNNIYIGDISVSGLTKNEAIRAVEEATSQTYTQLPMVVDLAGHELRLEPKNTKAKLNVKAAVEAAYAIGRTGTQEQREQVQKELSVQPHIIALLSYLELDHDYILDTLSSYAEDAGSTLTQTTYGLEGIQPELAADKFDENAPTQTLVITLGTPGIGFDYQDVYNQVLDAYSLNQFWATVEDVESLKDPDPIDLEAIYEEFYIAPVDATVNLQTFETIPGSYGYEFPIEEARKLLDTAVAGQEIRISMVYIEPEILDADMLFRDVLGESTVSHRSDKDRNKNLTLACDAINGTVLDPGQQFSFNQVVGERSSGNGYKKVFEIIRSESDETDEQVRGGGVSQVASALYHSALLSDMQIDYRVNQDFAPEYIQNGLDVSVDWRSPDFQFTNTSGYPVRIEASASEGKVTIRILGTDERSYYIKMESKVTATEEPGTKFKDFAFDNEEGLEDGDVIREGMDGFTVKTYKCKYDKSSGQLISRDFEATSKYQMVDKIVARVKPEPTTEPATEATTEPETEPPTEPSTEAATEPTLPPTTEEPAQPTETTVPTTTATEDGQNETYAAE